MKPSYKHVLIIPSWYKIPGFSTRGTFFQDQVRLLYKREKKVGVLCPGHRREKLWERNASSHKDEPTDFDDQGVPTYYCYTRNFIPHRIKFNWLDKRQIESRAYQVYKKYEGEHGRPDVIHAHCAMPAGIAAAYISGKTGIPFVLTEHLSKLLPAPGKPIPRFKKRTVEKVYAHSAANFAVSSFFRDQLKKHYRVDSLAVMPNVVNEVFFQDFQERSMSTPVDLCLVSIIKPGKNHELAVRALRLLGDADMDCRLYIVGSGALQSKVEALVKKLGLVDRVIFKGRLERDEVKKVIQDSHILLSPSLFETFGVSVAESLAVGRPVVAYDSGGVRDILKQSDGLLFFENSPEAFAEAIKEVVLNYPFYDQRQITHQCRQQFSELVIYSRLDHLYQRVTTAVHG
jgi:glycosyltransferase involved in cell wall biosynthesis